MSDTILESQSAEVPEFEETAFPGDNTPVSFKEKLILFLQAHWRGVVCFVTPIIVIPILTPFPPEKYQWCAYTLIIMAIFWVTECIPLPITSFLPIFVFPMTGVMNTRETCNCYINNLNIVIKKCTHMYTFMIGMCSKLFYNFCRNSKLGIKITPCWNNALDPDTILMFLGSLILAYAVEQSGLHKRLALFAIRAIGYSHYRLLFAMSFTTMFVSMWITNTAATTMMVPINFALLKVFESQNLLSIYETDSQGNIIASDIATCYFCSATFSATIGGVGTLVGTATNLVFKGLFNKAYPEAPEYLSFPNFSAFAIPYMLAMEGCMYLSMLIIYFGLFRPNSNAAKRATIPAEGKEAAKIAVNEDWRNLGKITFWEIMVIILFSGAMILFFCRSPQIFVGVRDSAVAMLIGFLMFLLPSTMEICKNFSSKDDDALPDKPVRSVLDWTIMNDVMPYSFMFLLGGGFALSEAAKAEHSDLNGKIGELLKHLRHLPNNFIIFLIIIFTVFITNFAANVAVCNVITPIVMQLAKQVNANPLWYNITAGFSASYCFCLPVGTPGNLIVQGAANIPTGKMIKAGIIPTVTTIFLTWISICFWAPVIWPDLHILPDWY